MGLIGILSTRDCDGRIYLSYNSPLPRQRNSYKIIKTVKNQITSLSSYLGNRIESWIPLWDNNNNNKSKSPQVTTPSELRALLIKKNYNNNNNNPIIPKVKPSKMNDINNEVYTNVLRFPGAKLNTVDGKPQYLLHIASD